MLETSARLLRLLSLLQARRDWTGAELANRLGVTSRAEASSQERHDAGDYKETGSSQPRPHTTLPCGE
jgi:hypothetical protein